MILRKVDCDLVDACSSHELHFHSVSRYAVCRSSTRELNLFRDDSSANVFRLVFFCT